MAFICVDFRTILEKNTFYSFTADYTQMRELQHRTLLKFIKYFDILPLLYALRRIRYLSAADKILFFRPKRKLFFDTEKRHYLLHAPARPPKRIILALHAARDTAKLFAYYSSLHNAVDDETLVVYPEATQSWYKDQGWNAKICCGPAMQRGVDDVGFLAALVERLRSEYKLPDLPVYLVGFSNGGMLAQYFATRHPQLCAGVVSMAASCGSCRGAIVPEKLPFPVCLVHGEQDQHIPFAGGSSPYNDYGPWTSFTETVRTWYAASVETSALVQEHILEEIGHMWPEWRLTQPQQIINEGSRLVCEFIDHCEARRA